jgi:hypothetical protein
LIIDEAIDYLINVSTIHYEEGRLINEVSKKALRGPGGMRGGNGKIKLKKNLFLFLPFF